MSELYREGYSQYRELSWLRFNDRVLSEAMDETVPLLERLKFIAIFTSNLDEFFMIRAGSLFDLMQEEPDIVDNKSGMTPGEQLGAIFEAVRQLRVAGFEVTIIDNTEAPDFGVQPPCVSDDTEIVVVLGGDGTILRAAELVHCTQVPILGVNMGHVGFLAEFESFQIDEAIRRGATHDYSIVERMIAHVDVWLPGTTKPIEDWALTDITLERADRGKMVELSIRVDDVEMNSFGADGVIVSTPTGSTAYAFSAGGPVMWPNVKALQLIPLAAHALFARPLIIGSGSTFTIDILDDSMSEGWICCDGRRQRALPQGTRVMVRESRDT